MSVRLNGQIKKKADPLDVLDDGTALWELLRPIYEQLIEEAYLGAADDGIDVSFELENTHVQGVLDQLAKTIKGIAESTRSGYQSLIGKQASEGWSMARLKNEIIADGAITDPARALLIARTESARATSLGSQAAWKQSGVVDRKQWLASADSCEDCQALDGTIVGLDEEFLPGVDTVPLHPACTCVLQPVLAD